MLRSLKSSTCLLYTSSDKIGGQQGTTAQYFVEGSDDWGFEGLPAEWVPYKSASLAVQDMINGNVKYVIIDAAPAESITKAINAMPVSYTHLDVYKRQVLRLR